MDGVSHPGRSACRPSDVTARDVRSPQADFKQLDALLFVVLSESIFWVFEYLTDTETS